MQVKHLLLHDITWLAGLFEGEGHFGWNRRTPVVHLSMTDSDIVLRVAELISYNKTLHTRELPSSKTLYCVYLYGKDAIEFMKLVEPYMGNRKTMEIRKAIALFSPKKKVEEIVA